MSFKERYLKYKKKYLSLKNQLGGENIKDFLNTVLSKDNMDLFRKIYRIIQINEKVSDYKALGLIVSKEGIINMMIARFDHVWLKDNLIYKLTYIFEEYSTILIKLNQNIKGKQLNIPSLPKKIWDYLKLTTNNFSFTSKQINEVLQTYNFDISPIFNINLKLYWDNNAFSNKTYDSYHEKEVSIEIRIGNYILDNFKIDDIYNRFIPWENISILATKEERINAGVEGVKDILELNKNIISALIQTKFKIDERLQFIYMINNDSIRKRSLLMNHNTSMEAVKSIFNSKFLKFRRGNQKLISIKGNENITNENITSFKSLAETYVYKERLGEIPTGDYQIIANWFYEGYYHFNDGSGAGPISLIFEIPEKVSQANLYVLDLNRFDQSNGFNLPKVKISNTNIFEELEEGQNVYQINSKFIQSGEGRVYTTPFDVDTSFIRAIATYKKYEKELTKFLKEKNIIIPIIVRDR
jgi:hypothetical protein